MSWLNRTNLASVMVSPELACTVRTAVRDGFSGVLVDGHDPEVWARVLAGLIGSPARLAELSRGALAHAAGFGWPATADRLIGVYTGAMASSVGPPAVVRA